MRIVFLVLGVTLIAGIASARVIHVPDDYSSIQSAINVSVDGDEVVLAPGLYINERLYFGPKNIVLRSEDPTSQTVVQETIISGASITNYNKPLIQLDGSQDENCRISGLTIERGQGGINGNGALATIENCIIQYNVVRYRQTGAYTYENPPGAGINDIDGLIQNNQFLYNRSCNDGAGMYDCDGWILNNTFIGNEIYECPEEGDGSCLSHCDGVIQGNMFTKNGPGGTLYSCYGQIIGNSFVDNDGYGILAWTSADAQDLAIEGNSFEDLSTAINLLYTSSDPDAPAAGAIPIRNNLFFDCFNGMANTNGTIENNLMVYTKDTLFIAIGLYNSHGPIRNNTIYGYTRSVQGVEMGIENCILWGIRDGTILQDEEHAPFVQNSCVRIQPANGENIIFTDPRFVDPENGDFRLRPDSPCIDSGRFQEGLADDVLGNPRPIKAIGWTDRGDGSGFDIGAYEYPEAIIPVDAETAGWMMY